MANKKVKKDKFLEAIKAARGTVTGVCELLDITRPTFYRYVEADKEIQEALEFARERSFDRAEYKLDEAIERGEMRAIEIKLTKHKRGRMRGYGDAMDITSDGEPLTIVIQKASDANRPKDK